MSTYIYSDDREEIRARAVEDHRHNEYDPRWIEESRARSLRCRLIWDRLRLIAHEAFRAGKFKDIIPDDDDDLGLVLEYSGLATFNEIVRWIAIDEAARGIQ